MGFGDIAKMVVSTDEGKTWTVRGGANVSKEFRAFDEHVIIEKKDGSLQMFCRVGCKNSSEHKLLGQKRIHPD